MERVENISPLEVSLPATTLPLLLPAFSNILQELPLLTCKGKRRAGSTFKRKGLVQGEGCIKYFVPRLKTVLIATMTHVCAKVKYEHVNYTRVVNRID